jgi:hypothetical protein
MWLTLGYEMTVKYIDKTQPEDATRYLPELKAKFVMFESRYFYVISYCYQCTPV